MINIMNDVTKDEESILSILKLPPPRFVNVNLFTEKN